MDVRISEKQDFDKECNKSHSFCFGYDIYFCLLFSTHNAIIKSFSINYKLCKMFFNVDISFSCNLICWFFVDLSS